MNFTEEVGIYFDTTSMLGRFLCLAKFDFSDRHENRFDSIVNFKREKIYFCHVESRCESREDSIRAVRIFFSSSAWNSWGLISEINSVTGVQISIVLINKQIVGQIFATKAESTTVQGFGGCRRRFNGTR